MDFPESKENIAVFAGGRRIGYVFESTARELIRSPGRDAEGKNIPAQYTMMPRKNHERRIMLVETSPLAVARARALCNTSGRAALSTTQREELYQGLRHPGHGQCPTDGPVTAQLTVVRKYRPGKGLLNWGETEKFPRRRFNEDKLPPSIYPSERAYLVARAAG